MTFEQLQSYIAAVESDTFAEAADAAHISQSALTKQIQKLERELGVQLLERSHRTTSLTPSGEIVYGEAKELTARYRSMLERLAKLESGARITVGALPILSQYGLTDRIHTYMTTYPEDVLVIEEAEEKALTEGLRNGRYDFVIARENMVAREQIVAEIARDELVLALPEDHELADNGHVGPAELAGLPLFMMSPYTAVYEVCMALFECAGVRPNVVRTGRVESMLSAAAVQRGVCLLPYNSFRLFRYQGLTAIPLEPPVELPVVLAANQNSALSKMARRFVGFWL